MNVSGPYKQSVEEEAARNAVPSSTSELQMSSVRGSNGRRVLKQPNEGFIIKKTTDHQSMAKDRTPCETQFEHNWFRLAPALNAKPNVAGIQINMDEAQCDTRITAYGLQTGWFNRKFTALFALFLLLPFFSSFVTSRCQQFLRGGQALPPPRPRSLPKTAYRRDHVGICHPIASSASFSSTAEIRMEYGALGEDELKKHLRLGSLYNLFRQFSAVEQMHFSLHETARTTQTSAQYSSFNVTLCRYRGRRAITETRTIKNRSNRRISRLHRRTGGIVDSTPNPAIQKKLRRVVRGCLLARTELEPIGDLRGEVVGVENVDLGAEEVTPVVDVVPAHMHTLSVTSNYYLV
ncbi:hypothetical protein C8R45DRAFT_1188670 [Mycena sanguinolenta]|nr:hypothetical protein C8R45DRAFT_1188670 [Mycena sanguinolenta]